MRFRKRHRKARQRKRHRYVEEELKGRREEFGRWKDRHEKKKGGSHRWGKYTYYSLEKKRDDI